MKNLLSAIILSGKKSKYFSLVYNALVGGSINGETTQLVKKGASGTLVEAIAAENNIFLKWSDDVATAARADSNVQANLNVNAIFDSTLPPVPLGAANSADWSMT